MIDPRDPATALLLLVLIAHVVARYALPVRGLRIRAGAFATMVWVLIAAWNPVPAMALGVVHLVLTALSRLVTGVFGDEGNPAPRRLAVLAGTEALTVVALAWTLGLFTAPPEGWLTVHTPWWLRREGLIDLSRAGALPVVLGYLVVTVVGSAVIRIAIAPFEAQIREQRRSNEDGRGLRDAGRAIGLLESTVIYVLMLTGNASGVGFLIAAKSIFRFGELRESANRKEAEYFLIGTLMSFAWSLAVSAAVMWLPA